MEHRLRVSLVLLQQKLLMLLLFLLALLELHVAINEDWLVRRGRFVFALRSTGAVPLIGRCLARLRPIVRLYSCVHFANLRVCH